MTVLPNAVTVEDHSVATDAGVATAPIDVLASATTDSGQELDHPTVTTEPANGSVTVDEDGNLVYVPDAGFSGTDSFTYQVCDTSYPDPVCAEGTITVTVEPEPVSPDPSGSEPSEDPAPGPEVSQPTVAPGPGGRGILATTGAQVTSAVVSALVLMTAGAALLVVRRRRVGRA